jgi:hypothetical protein
MGSGAPKKFDSIPTNTVVGLLAAEANLDEAWRDVAKAVGEVFEDPESVQAWRHLGSAKETYRSRSFMFVNMVNSLLRSQSAV